VGQAPPARPIFAEALARRGGVQAVVRDGWKLQYAWTGEVTAYDRVADPSEATDLYDPTDPRVLSLWADLVPMIHAMEPLVLGGSPAPVWPPGLPE
jgi:hypothetical protein